MKVTVTGAKARDGHAQAVSDLPRSARRVHDALVALGLPADILRLEDSTRTAPEAAAAVGCELGAIVKSLVFRGTASGEPLLALVSGDNRADEALVADAFGESIERPDAAYVREVTGYAIGGIPPVGHPSPVRVAARRGPVSLRDRLGRGRQPARGLPVAPAALAQATGAQVTRMAAA